MPYLFFEPIYIALMEMAVKEKSKNNPINLNRLVQKIITERLQNEGYLKDPKKCLHEHLYQGRGKSKPIICRECGIPLSWEGDMDEVDAKLKEYRKGSE